MRSSVAPPKRIALIVEHHVWLRSTLIGLFEEIGYVVSAASNGIAALRLVTEVRPSIVVLGAGLPELSGELVAAELMAMRHLSGLQVVLASDLLRHVLDGALQTSRAPRWRDQIDTFARRLSAPHPGTARSRAPRASTRAGRAPVLRPAPPGGSRQQQRVFACTAASLLRER
jgi:CheY-like chemotaxis protein